MVLFQVLGLSARQVLLALAGQTCHGQPWLVLLAAGLVVMLGRGEGVSVEALINGILSGFRKGAMCWCAYARQGQLNAMGEVSLSLPMMLL